MKSLNIKHFEENLKKYLPKHLRFKEQKNDRCQNVHLPFH